LKGNCLTAYSDDVKTRAKKNRVPTAWGLGMKDNAGGGSSKARERKKAETRDKLGTIMLRQMAPTAYK